HGLVALLQFGDYSQFSHTRSAPPNTIGETPKAMIPQNKASLKTSRLRCMAVSFHPRCLSPRLRAKRSRASLLRPELSLVRCAQPGRGKPHVYVRSGLSLAGSADKALALEARRCSPGLLAQTNNCLC